MGRTKKVRSFRFGKRVQRFFGVNSRLRKRFLEVSFWLFGVSCRFGKRQKGCLGLILRLGKELKWFFGLGFEKRVKKVPFRLGTKAKRLRGVRCRFGKKAKRNSLR